MSAVLDRLAAPAARTGSPTSRCCRRAPPLPLRGQEWAEPAVRTAYAGQGVRELWTHQAVAADAGYAGSHVVLATGTASGKSLAYQLPALSTILQRRRPRAQRGRHRVPGPHQSARCDQSCAVGRSG
ncbi:MAG: hypothetical protein R2734_04160 [Nocardioides sp.]